MAEPTRHRIIAGQVAKRCPLCIAVGVKTKAAILRAVFVGHADFDENATSKGRKLDEHKSLQGWPQDCGYGLLYSWGAAPLLMD